MVSNGKVCADFNLTMGPDGLFPVDLCGRPISNLTLSDYPTNQPTRYLGQVVFPLLLILSIAGNLFCIRVFLTERRKKSPVVYLIVLCTANIFVMLLDLPSYIGTYFESVREQAGYIDFMEGSVGCLAWVQQTFILISNWVLIISTVQRILLKTRAPGFPLRVRVRQAIAACAVLLVACALASIPDFVLYNQWWNHTQDAGQCDVTPTMLCDWLDKWSRIRRSMDVFLFDMTLPLLTFLILLIAAGTLLILNARRKRIKKASDSGDAGMTKSERRRLRSHSRLISEGGAPPPIQINGVEEDFEIGDMPRHEVKYASMLNRSIVLYLATHAIDIIFTVIVLLANHPSCALNLPHETTAMWQPVVHTITLVNYSANWLLYLSLLGRLRDLWKKTLRTPVARAGDYEMVSQDPARKIVRFADRMDDGLVVQVPQMRREKSSVLLPQPVGTILTGEQFRELWMFLPFRTRIYQPQMIFTTSEDGTSITNFLNTVRGYGATILVIRTMKSEIFGAYCGSSWDERILGKREYLYFGTGETFLFVFKPDLSLYPWIGLSGRKTSPDSCLYMAADAHHLSIGGGGQEAINFESSLARGFSGSSLTFNNEPLCSHGEFESMVVEVYAFTDTMI